jgi:hypothetical protein
MTGKTTTIERLCEFAGIEYGMMAGPDRKVHLVQSGGHRKVPVPGRQRRELYLDMSLIPPNTDKKARTIEALTALAVDLDCYEAGESLSPYGIVETQMNGKFTRRELVPKR